MLWLQEASRQGVSVKHWVVLDDDDLLQRGPTGGHVKAGRQRTGPREYSMVGPAKAGPAEGRPASPVPPATCDGGGASGSAVDEEDPWALAF